MAWVDYSELREKLDFIEVLKHFNVEVKVKGDRATGLCPLPTHPQRADGKRTPSFSAHLGKGIWQCFGCGARGNVVEFGAMMLGLDPDDRAQFRQAAIKLADIFGIECPGRTHQKGMLKARPKKTDRSAARKPEKPSAEDGLQAAMEPSTDSAKRVLINEPIEFELKNLDPNHPYLLNRGFTAQTIEHFGLGFCSRGLMKDRIAIPIHDPLGRLVGYAGRLTDDSKIDDEHPRYLFPGARERDGVVHEFRKSMLVYNLHRLGGKMKDLIVVEGFASVWWLHQHGHGNAVALMGSSCSPEQATLISDALENDGRISLIPDGDEAGERLASQALPMLAQYRFSRLIRLPRNQQPTDRTANELECLISG